MKLMDQSMFELSTTQKLRLRLFGQVSVGTRMKEGWKGPMEHYAFRCPKHGIVINYSSGWKQHLCCPICGDERRAESLTRKSRGGA